MVKGIDKFKEFFSSFDNNYVIIGGTACTIALRDTDMQPRATDDIDMILIVENITSEFGKRFWEFIELGKYENRERKRDESKEPATELYRFIKPQEGFPVQIELLSRFPNKLGKPTNFHLTPIPLGDDIPSLSAILLDDVYYELTLKESLIEDELRIASPLSLICLKARAYLNLTEEKKINSNIRSSDIKKHRDDVFKLLAMRIDPFTPVELESEIKDCIRQFIDVIESSLPNISLENSLQRDSEDIIGYIQIMKEVFKIEEL